VLVSLTVCPALVTAEPAATQPSKAKAAADKAAQGGFEIARLQLEGEVPESSAEISLFSSKRPSTLEKWLRRLAQARNDVKVCAVVLEIGDFEAGYAQIQELRAAIGRVREAGKPVYAYLTDADLRNYAVASACDEVMLAPGGHLLIPGMHLQMWFYKDLLDKLGVQADVLHIGAYKGAGEPYTRTGPTDELKEEMTNLVDDLYEQTVEQIAKARDLEPQEVKKLIDTGIFSPAEAIDANLVDKSLQLDDLLEDLEDQYDATTVEDYGTKSATKADMSNPFAFFRMFSRPSTSAAKGKGKPVIGLVLLSGMIVDRKEDGLFESGLVAPEDIQKAVEAALEDDNIKAVVLRIDSPGGSSLASDIMHAHVRRLVAEKPVIVSMGNVAASGGYYVASAAPTILADPGTITGSIGVLGGKPVISGLLQKVGITTWTLERGEMAGMFDLTSPFNPAQRDRVLKLMTHIYGTFLERVLATRKEKLTKPIDEVAGGRVFSGQRALGLGLVDKLGGLTDAVYLAAEQAGVKDYEVRIIPKPKNFLELLMDNLVTGMDEESLAIGQYASRMIPGLSDPTAAQMRRAISRVLLQVRMLKSESVLMLMSYDTNLVPR
jgi:protease-4